MTQLYFNMTCAITIGKVKFNAVNSINIKGSIKQLSDTATIVLPREYSNAIVKGRVESLQKKNIRDFIKEGDEVVIELGYNNRLQTRFKGYLKSVGADAPLVLECEDEMWKLRKTNYTKTFRAVTLLELLQYIAPGYEYDVIDNIELGKFPIDNASAYDVLGALRKDCLLHSYFRDKTLVVAFPADLTPNKVHKINFNRNVRNSQNLKFLRKEEMKLQIKAISNNSDGTKFIETVGETGGSTKTLNFANKSRTFIKNLAQKNLDSLHYDGYHGSMMLFGEPVVSQGEAVDITDPIYANSERDGKYLIESVETSFNDGGYSQNTKLSLKL